MRILIIGAGSIAHVYGYYLSKGGNDVSFAARKDRIKALRQGLLLQKLTLSQKPIELITFKSFDTLEFENIPDKGWDQIYFCIPSNALSYDLIHRVNKIAGHAIIVKLQPGLLDKSIFSEQINKDNLVTGMISFIAFPDVAENSGELATHYWFPPLLKTYFSGSTKAVNAITNTLNKSQFPSAYYANVDFLVGQILAYEAPLLAGLEISGWNLEEFLNSEIFEDSFHSVFEVIDIVSFYYERKRPMIFHILSKPLIKIATLIMAKILPFHFEDYLKDHFTKLSEQSRNHLKEIIEFGETHELRVDKTKSLYMRL